MTKRVAKSPPLSPAASPAEGAMQQPAASASKGKRARASTGGLPEVSKLPPELQKLVDEMLVEGDTFEDILETIQERGQVSLSLRAVQSHFRSSPALQQQRVKRQLEAAQALKEAVGNPESAQKDLVDAVLLTGLMRVNRRGSEITTQDAVLEQYKRENLRLRNSQARMRWKKICIDRRLAESRLETERNRQQAIKAKILEMQQLMETRQGRKELGTEALKKIQEIYGLITEEKPQGELVSA